MEAEYFRNTNIISQSCVWHEKSLEIITISLLLAGVKTAFHLFLGLDLLSLVLLIDLIVVVKVRRLVIIASS